MVQLSFWKQKMLKASKIKTGTSSLESDQIQERILQQINCDIFHNNNNFMLARGIVHY